MSEPIRTPIEQNLIERISGAVRGAVSGWMSPGLPLRPVVPESQKQDVEGRAFDYPVAYNIVQAPRRDHAITFSTLRGMADGYDLMRLIIETRKDQIGTLDWAITDKNGKEHAEASAFFASPDKENAFSDWVRMLVEEVLVTDAATIYPRLTNGGKLYSLDLLDGATISPKINILGRKPLPPETAYQQVLKGLPAVDYTSDELLYMPRNKRVHKVYGFSPVEQVITTVNIALRRQTSQLQYFTEGSTPDLILSVPENWNSSQIADLSRYWNDALSGNTAERRGTKFLPGGVSIINTKDTVLKDQFDEWLARVVCFAFSVAPEPFIAQVNRATAETSAMRAEKEGIMPLAQWLEEQINRIIAVHFPGAKFAWQMNREIDPLKQAQIDQTYIAAGVYTPRHVAERMGIEFEEPEAQQTATAPADAPAEKLAKGSGKESPRIKKLTKVLHANLQKVAAFVLGDVGKADDTTYSGILDRLNKVDWMVAVEGIDRILSDEFLSGASVAVAQVGAVSFDLPETSLEFAQERAAELVGMRRVGGELVPNPNAQWRIDETTREEVRAKVALAIEEGWGAGVLAGTMLEGPFGAWRSETIARTELAFSHVAGAKEVWKNSGVVAGTEWLAHAECCDECQAMNGKKAGLDGVFEGGEEVPKHPNCRCTLLPILE